MRSWRGSGDEVSTAWWRVRSLSGACTLWPPPVVSSKGGDGNEVMRARLGDGCGVSQGHVRGGQHRLLRVRVVTVTRLRASPLRRLHLCPSPSCSSWFSRTWAAAVPKMLRCSLGGGLELHLSGNCRFCSRRSTARCRRKVRRWRVGNSRRSSTRARRRVRIPGVRGAGLQGDPNEIERLALTSGVVFGVRLRLRAGRVLR